MTVEDLIAEQVALSDIKKELKSCGKVFINFRMELNPVMEKLVEEQKEEQEKLSWCLSIFTIKKV